MNIWANNSKTFREHGQFVFFSSNKRYNKKARFSNYNRLWISQNFQILLLSQK